MKVFWKLLMRVEGILLLLFTAFGCVLMHFSFENALKNVKIQGTDEMRMFQYALLTSMENLPDSYTAMDMAVSDMAENFQENLTGRNDIIRIYNSKKQIVYETEAYPGNLMEQLEKEARGVSRIAHHETGYYMESLVLLESSIGNYYLEMDRNISDIYEEREALLRNYQLSLVVAILVSLVLTVLLSLDFTRPIRRLSFETRQFAQGDYKSRVIVKGNDEITDLMKSFNQMADALEANMEKLREDARRQEDFTSAFAHELKTPLTSVIGYAEILRSQNLSDEAMKMSADYIYQQGKRLERLSFKLMELVGMRQGEFFFQKLLVRALTEQLVNASRSLLKEKNIRLHQRVLKGSIYGEADLLMSLFLNLMDNARKACGQGGNIWISGIAQSDGYLFLIRDDGRGIPEEEINKITEAFYMVDKSRARKEGGAGIGMALCKMIVELHHATWQIKSRVGEGTCVEILFPMDEQQE